MAAQASSEGFWGAMFVITNKHSRGCTRRKVQRQAIGRVGTPLGEPKLEPMSGLWNPGGKLLATSMRRTRFL